MYCWRLQTEFLCDSCFVQLTTFHYKLFTLYFLKRLKIHVLHDVTKLRGHSAGYVIFLS